MSQTASVAQPDGASAPIGESAVSRLADALRSEIRGEVRFSDGDRALYATDASNYRQVPIGVVIPRDVQDITNTIAICRRFGAPVLSRGGGTSLAGQCCNFAVVMDMSKYFNRILELDAGRRFARVQPGLVLDTLRDAAEEHRLTFAPDPATHTHCTFGGMLGNNSCGVHSVMGGKTGDNTDELEILTYDGLRMHVGPTNDDELQEIINAGGRRGEIYSRLRELRDKYADLIRARFPDIPRRVSGYALDQLLPENGFNVARALVGSEGTCVTILEAKVRLVYSPPVRSLLVLGYPDVYTAGDHLMELLEHKPTGLEGFDAHLVEDMKKKGLHPQYIQLLPDGGGWLLVEFGGESNEESDGKARQLMDQLRKSQDPPTMKLFDDAEQEHMIWKVREGGLGATARIPSEPDTWAGWEDSAVHPSKVGDYLRELRKLVDRYHYNCALYGHFGQGCIHTRIDFDLKTADGIAKFRSFLTEAAHLVVSFGGSISGEHGDGQARAALLPIMYGDELVKAFEEFKRIWDPQGRMNPGKIVDPHQPDQDLRFGSNYGPRRVDTIFQFSDDNYSFGYATERCVGVGNCRRDGGGTMCPSYMATHEEMHSTRGRAHMLWEMMQGQTVKGGWRDKHVHESLDLCLACKGCKSDCPVNVDMATYKAEFYAHYYHRRLRPLAAYSMGLIYWWARLASRTPRVVNAVTHAPLISNLFKRLGGIAPQRKVPTFAHETFRDWFEQRPAQSREARTRTVILFPDTFTNFFLPGRGKAAVQVLEAADVRVRVPRRMFCCGRPLYDWGMLDQAKALWKQMINDLRPWIRQGLDFVVVEPSCAAAFRDELPLLFPHDEDALRLSKQTFMLSEYLAERLPGYQPPRILRKALVQSHCHHKSVIKFDTEQELMKKMGLDADVLDSGCCGMAGAFGFQPGEHYDVSMACGERVLLPAVREAPDDTLIIADGFSCLEQIQQTTGRKALNISEVLKMALDAQQQQKGNA